MRRPKGDSLARVGLLTPYATTTTLGCARASSRRTHSPVAVGFLVKRAIAALAPWISFTRMFLLPRLLIPSSLVRPPVKSAGAA